MRPHILLIFTVLILTSSFAGASGPEEDRLNDLISHFDKKGRDIRPLLEDPRFERIPNITEKFTKAAERRIESIDEYKQVLGYDKKSTMVQDFMSTWAKELAEAEKKYGIPKEVIVGIIGVESEYGTYAGSYNPFAAYVSMYVENHRAKFALAQLEELLKFTDRTGLDVLELKSSYAGAMSYAQFIPYSLNRWWIGDDLYHMPNNIYSVANYLAHFKDITGSVEKAILRYNNSTLYQQAVLSLAEEARSK